MTDMSPEFDFTAATNAAIAAAETPAETEATDTTPAEPQPEEQPADATEDTDAPDEPDPADHPAADVGAELAALKQRLADKDEFIDRQGNELGDLRKAFEERFETLTEQVNRPTPTRVTADLIDNDPGGATRLAWEQQDQHALTAAFQAWKDEDPAAAGAWSAYTAAQGEMQQLREQQQKELKELRDEFAPISQANDDQRVARQVQALTSKYSADEITAFVQSDTFTTLADEFPDVKANLASDPAKAIENLFLVHRGRTADTLNRTVQEVARESAETAAQATSDAFVASASTATSTTSEPKTEAEMIAEGMAARIRQREAVWADGWERG